jgi:hypothetical protein
MIKKLIKIANTLDSKGLNKEADLLDNIINKLAKNDTRFFLDEELELNKSFFNDKFNIIKLIVDKVCEEINLSTPMFLGSGYTAYAFSASDEDGENIVLKIMTIDRLSRYKEIYENKDYDHPILPKIFDVKELNDLSLSFDELSKEIYNDYIFPIIDNYGIVIMEELEPIDKSLGKLLGESLISNDYNYRIFIEGSREFVDLKNNLISNIDRYLTRLKISPKTQKDIIENIFVLFNILLNKAEGINSFNLNNEFNEIYSDFIKFIEKKLNNYKDEVFINYKNKIFKYIENEISSFFQSLITIVNKDPEGMESSGIPGQKSFIEQINSLKDMGITPADIHSENIMIRPSTGEFVISDIGHFKFNSLFEW